MVQQIIITHVSPWNRSLKTTGRAAGEGTHGHLWHLGCMLGCYSTSEAKRELGETTTFATYTGFYDQKYVQWVYYDAGWWFQLFLLRELAWWSQLTFMLRGSNHAPENHSINWSLVCWSQLVSCVVWEDMEWWYRMIRKRLYFHMYYVFRHIILFDLVCCMYDVEVCNKQKYLHILYIIVYSIYNYIYTYASTLILFMVLFH